MDSIDIIMSTTFVFAIHGALFVVSGADLNGGETPVRTAASTNARAGTRARSPPRCARTRSRTSRFCRAWTAEQAW